VFPLALLLLAASTRANAGVEVRVEGPRVSVRAEAAPLSEVLDRLAKQLGMKLTYEGAAPRVLVSAALENRTPAEAVLGVLEGLGLDYLARMDASGTRIDALIVSTSGASASAAGSPIRPPAPPMSVGRAIPQPADDDEDLDDEEVPDEAPPTKPRPGRTGAEADPQRQGGGSMLGRPQVPGLPSAPSVPGVVNAPAFPVSPFAPQPTLPTAPQPTAPPEVQDDDQEE
jgi:hypothetical protein